jgi:hypothetical protein
LGEVYTNQGIPAFNAAKETIRNALYEDGSENAMAIVKVVAAVGAAYFAGKGAFKIGRYIKNKVWGEPKAPLSSEVKLQELESKKETDYAI